MKHALIFLVMGAICVSGSARIFAEDQQPTLEGPWMMSPQICRGKPWSSTAKAAGWKYDAENSVCRATARDRPMIAKVRPLERGTFIVNVGLQMQKDAILRLFMDELAFDLSDNGQTIRVADGPEYLKFHVERPEDQRWSTLRVERKQETLSVTLNGKEVVRFDDKGRSYEQVGLKPIDGTIEVNRFSLTGHLAMGKRDGVETHGNGSATPGSLVYVDMRSGDQHPLVCGVGRDFPAGRELAFRNSESGESVHAVFPEAATAPEDLNGSFILHGHYQGIQNRDHYRFKRPKEDYRYFVVSSWEQKK